MAPVSAPIRLNIRTSLPCCAGPDFVTLHASIDRNSTRKKGVHMFIFSRPIIAPLAALCIAALIVILDHLYSLGAIS